jgi:hypothetical protein
MSDTKHTPTPYSAQPHDDEDTMEIWDHLGAFCTCIKANAEFIVKACNCHDELLGALKGIMQGIGDACDCVDGEPKGHCFLCLARAAIAKAEGENHG